MAKTTGKSTKSANKPVPVLDPELREKQMVGYAVDLAEKMLIEGTAPASVITHYLKLGTQQYINDLLEQEENIKLLKAKTSLIEETKLNNELYAEVIRNMHLYQGSDPDDE